MIATQNWFATFALLSWPLVALWLYSVRPVGQATMFTIIGALLLLPQDAIIKFEGVPQFDKVSIPNLAALVGCIFIAKRPLRFWSRFGLPEVLIVAYIICPFITAELNTDVIFFGNRTLNAESHYDAVSAIVNAFINLIPFFIGRQLLRSSADNVEIMRVLLFAGLLYSLPILFELRMGPQLSYLVYGWQADNIVQAFRDGGYRPTVFMGHGLPVSFFMMTTVVAAAALWRTRIRVTRLAPTAITVYLFGILLLCKSAASIVYGTVLLCLVRWTKPLFQIRVALVLAAICFFYPALRITQVFPTRSLTETATLISEDRALSLQQRFENEDLLLARASQRFLFGWGRWGRSRVYDQSSGVDISVTDGGWIITLGQWGLFGFVAEFGVLTLCVVRAASAFNYTKSNHDKIFLAALALIVAITLIDQLPNNASLNPWSLLLAGALLGRAEALRVKGQQMHNSVTNSTYSGSNASPRLQAGSSAFKKRVSD